MYELINKFIDFNVHKKKRKSFYLDDIEKYLIQKCGGYSNYHKKGGYYGLYDGMQKMTQEGHLKPMKTSDYNGQYPPLKTRWTIVEKKAVPLWRSEEFLKLSDLLDLSTYIKHPELQTDEEWRYILRIYEFLRNRENRKWASCEERCLELFDNEKFLDPKEGQDIGVLKRLKLSNEDLKMKKYGQMFVYWNKGVRDIKNAIILENHSTFFSYKRAAMEGYAIFGFVPDAIIYGQGKDIINSFSFIEEIAGTNDLKVLYFGDVDPEGYMIYKSLKEVYNHINISLQLEAYKKLLDSGKSYTIRKNQNKNIENLNFILKEFEENNYYKEAQKLKKLWDMNKRIPQELITYEYLMRH